MGTRLCMTSGKSLAKWSNATLFVCLVCKLVGTDLPAVYSEVLELFTLFWSCSVINNSGS